MLTMSPATFRAVYAPREKPNKLFNQVSGKNHGSAFDLQDLVTFRIVLSNEVVCVSDFPTYGPRVVSVE